MTPDQRLRASFATDTAYRCLSPDGRDPYPFQHAGVEYAVGLKDCLIADDMGAGKTIQGIGWLNMIGARRPLIVCPASLRINWKRELERWALWDPEASIPSYEEVTRHGAPQHDVVIFDEAHYLKTPDSKRSVACLKLPAERRLFLTGTPVSNRPIELWPILRSLDPKMWGSRTDYGMTYCGGRWNGYEWDFKGASNLVDLQRQLRSRYMIRRLKKDVLKDLPPKTRQLIELPAQSTAKTAELLAAVRTIWKARQSAFDPESVAKLKDARHVVMEKLSATRHEEALSKVPAIVAHIRDLLESVEKVVVFAHHVDVIDGLAAALQEFGVCSVRGGMTDTQKQAGVDAFQSNPAVRVFIGQDQAAREGLTLTAASTVVFAELDWVPGNMCQCEDRCHRIGQKDNVLVQYLVLDGSLDARIAKSIIRKQAVIDQALNADAPSGDDLDWVAALATGE